MADRKLKDDDNKISNSDNNNKSIDDSAAAIIGGLACLAIGGAALYGIGKGLKKLFLKSKDDKDKDIEDYISSHRPITTYEPSSYQTNYEYSSST